jgi:hypothetical protein
MHSPMQTDLDEMAYSKCSLVYLLVSCAAQGSQTVNICASSVGSKAETLPNVNRTSS